MEAFEKIFEECPVCLVVRGAGEVVCANAAARARFGGDYALLAADGDVKAADGAWLRIKSADMGEGKQIVCAADVTPVIEKLADLDRQVEIVRSIYPDEGIY